MKLKFTILLLVFFVFTGCNSSSTDKQKELELKEKEIALKEKELKLKETEQTSNKESSNKETEQNSNTQTSNKAPEPAKNNDLSNIENLIGSWFKPHEATTNIKFFRDGRFEFNDYNTSKEEEELLTGTFKLSNGTLTLMYDDRPKQDFKFYKGDKGDTNYYIRKGEYYFVKGDN